MTSSITTITHKTRPLIDGRLGDATNGRTFEVDDSGTGEVAAGAVASSVLLPVA